MAFGGGELLIVLALALLLFGPKKLPELARGLGQAVAEYNKAQKEFEKEVQKVSAGVNKEFTSIETASKAQKPTQQPQALQQVQPQSAATSGIPTYSSQKISEIAKNLGIDRAGKSDAQLLKEISEKTKQAEAKSAELKK